MISLSINDTRRLHPILQLIRAMQKIRREHRDLAALGNLGKCDDLGIREKHNVLLCHNFLGLVFEAMSWMDNMPSAPERRLLCVKDGS